MKQTLAIAAVTATVLAGCGSSDCGPTSATVERVIDGDTIELTTGERIRYIGIDTPESTNGRTDCYGQEAKARNAELVEGQEITIEYDLECTDRYDRLLGYVSVGGDEVNRRLVAEGYACTLFIPPNGSSRENEYRALEGQAQQNMTGLWGACEVVTCD